MLSLLRRSVAAVASAAVVTFVMTGGYSSGAQESKATKTQTNKSKSTAKSDAATDDESTAKHKVAPPDPTHRVPPGYAKLGLTDQQKDALYKIQAKYYSQIQALEKQADALRSKRETEFEAVLTPAQRRLLEQQEQEKKAAAKAKKAAAVRAAEKS